MAEPTKVAEKITIALTVIGVTAAWLAVPGFWNPFRKPEVVRQQPDSVSRVSGSAPAKDPVPSIKQDVKGPAPQKPAVSFPDGSQLGSEQFSQLNKEEKVVVPPSQPSVLEDCSISGQLSVKTAKLRLLYKGANPFIEAFVDLENSSQDPVSFIQIGPAHFTDSASRQTDSSTSTAPASKTLPGPGGIALVGVANASERLDPGRSKSFTLDFPVAADTHAQNGELTFELATFTGKNISGAGFATKAESQSVHCVGK